MEQKLDKGSWSLAAPLLLDLAELGAQDGDTETVQHAAARLETIAANAKGLPLYRALADLGAAWSAHVTGDDHRASELAGTAGATFDTLGYRGLLSRALSLQDRCRIVMPRVREALPNGLTEREAEVLRLVATGKTNKQIAEELHLSAKTVGRHMSNIFTKTGVNTRSAATTFAHRHGIVRPAPAMGHMPHPNRRSTARGLGDFARCRRPPARHTVQLCLASPSDGAETAQQMHRLRPSPGRSMGNSLVGQRMNRRRWSGRTAARAAGS